MRCCRLNVVRFAGHEIDQTILTLITHGFTGVVVWVELFWIPHKYRNWKLESGIAVAYGVTYLVWNMICYSQNDVWAYPTLQVRTTMENRLPF